MGNAALGQSMSYNSWSNLFTTYALHPWSHDRLLTGIHLWEDCSCAPIDFVFVLQLDVSMYIGVRLF